MTKRELILAALSANGINEHTPVQIQKLLFLIDKNIGHQLGGPIFNFQPYDYGPFDASIYSELRQLQSEGLVSSIPTPNGWEVYYLTSSGYEIGRNIFPMLHPNLASYISELSRFVRSLSFGELVSAIYREYPEMKVNSVFRG
jgi:hypothetical protein